MKKNEIALIILVVSIAAAITYFAVAAIIPTPGKKAVTVESVEVIKPTVVEPSTDVFNKDAINPTVKIKIGDQSNQQPFDVSR